MFISQRLHIFSSWTSKLIGKYSNNFNCFQWWPIHWVKRRPARMTLKSLLQSSLWNIGVKKKKSTRVPDISPLPLWVVVLLWLNTHNLMKGLPPIYRCISSLRLSHNDISTVRDYLSKNYLIWDKSVQARESCTDNASCANLDPESSWFAFHWLLRWSSWGNKSALDFPYSVEVVGHFPLPFSFPLGVYALLSLSVPILYTLGCCGSHPFSVFLISFLELCIRGP